MSKMSKNKAVFKNYDKEQLAASSLSLKNLSKSFRGTPAVQDLWLEIGAGEIVSLLGPSGCGKSTTLQLIAGILRPDAGQIDLGHRSLNQVPPEKRNIALILQKGLLFPHLSVGENVAFGLKMQGVNRLEREQRATAMLNRVQLSGFENRLPTELSGGQAQRVALARSLVIAPQVLLLDEPLSALDANLREEMQALILQLQADTQVTMVIVTHDQAEAVVMSHRIALMFEGRLRQVATPEEFYRCPTDETTARFFGGVNFFQVKTSAGWIKATIRPEQIQVFAAPQPPAKDLPNPSPNLLPMAVTANQFTGTQRRLTLKAATGPSLQAWVGPSNTFSIGQSVWAHLPPAALWRFPNSENLSGAAMVGYGVIQPLS
ncbi:MAG: ABC transporter ATP-binding protein [Phormidesmis priestleyi]|uniref:ABC-type quaternary amine transporter n=1 Tax=Phormidesmis priestleyi TaxID=268141 RepID=A0A2W4Y827_9CYAN|nr:MAG: ABC transporter ATP-binding protein [Phormidesmis priestleyi]